MNKLIKKISKKQILESIKDEFKNFYTDKTKETEEEIINEKKDRNDHSNVSKKDRGGLDGLYTRVQNRLDNEIWNHADIMRGLGWGGKDDTNRSLFSKKLRRAKNDDGSVYEFSVEDLEKIISILDNQGK